MHGTALKFIAMQRPVGGALAFPCPKPQRPVGGTLAFACPKPPAECVVMSGHAWKCVEMRGKAASRRRRPGFCLPQTAGRMRGSAWKCIAFLPLSAELEVTKKFGDFWVCVEMRGIA